MLFKSIRINMQFLLNISTTKDRISIFFILNTISRIREMILNKISYFKVNSFCSNFHSDWK